MDIFEPNYSLKVSPLVSIQQTKVFSVISIGSSSSNSSSSNAVAPKKQASASQPTSRAAVSSTSAATGITDPAVAIDRSILDILAKNENASINDSYELAQSNGWDHNALVGELKSLESDEYVILETNETKYYVLTEEGNEYAKAGTPEFIALDMLVKAQSDGSVGIKPAQYKSNPALDIGFMQCMKNKWSKMDKASGMAVLAISAEDAAALVDEVQNDLRKIEETNGDVNAVADEKMKLLVKRKLAKIMTRKSFKVTRGPAFSPVRAKAEAELTKELMENDTYKEVKFKPYNFHSLGLPVSGGYLHPLLQVRNEFRKILIGMGFEEMPTSEWVESSYWNFDSLFQPQQHPARDAHDTFFVKEPATANLASVPREYIETVRRTHEMGGNTGSKGYNYNWSEEESRKNIMRTHTTAVSAKMLYRLANQPGGFKPKKYFSIDRVFRNEDIDKTHLAEFHQVEGLVADYDLTLGSLIGTIKTFFEAIGITELRFKAAYNPYTEPSMEIFGFHPQLNKWTEIGNSGMFRPEMLRPMGLPEGVRVIAWGLSLERPTMIMTGENHIKNLFGSGVSIDMLRSFAFPRFT